MAKLLATAILLAASVFGLYCYSALHQPLKIPESDYLLLEKGANLTTLTADLSKRGLLGLPASLFRYYGIFTSDKGTIKVGEYSLSPELNAVTLLQKLRRGDVIKRVLTFPEGWQASEWLSLIASNLYIKHTPPDLLTAEIGDPTGLDGTLFPDTYHFTRGESDITIIRRAQARMNQVLATAWENRTSNAAVTTIQQAIILASIIEKETGYGPDRGLIASVFNNRLARGMRLQSDPTVIYGLQHFDGDLRRNDLSKKHPYNTYVIPGLPEGPICNPGLEAINAALQPPASPYYYFVAKGNGESHFSTTLAEHNAAVARYQKAGRVENYRSTIN